MDLNSAQSVKEEFGMQMHIDTHAHSNRLKYKGLSTQQ